MKIIINIGLIIWFGLVTNSLLCQNLHKESLIKNESDKEIFARYKDAEPYDAHVELTLYKNNRYKYLFYATVRGVGLIEGTWSIEADSLVLRADWDKDSIPVRLEYLDSYTDSLRVKKTKIGMPKNIDGEWLPDSRVFVNTDSVYYFPFFDTCVGTYSQIDSIKVDFDGDFKSRWMAVTRQDFKLLKITALINFFPLKIDYFSTRRYRISGNELMLEE